MHRQPLLELLAEYEAAWPSEASVARRIRTLVEAHADCFDRTCRPGHITGSAWVVSADGQRHLLLHHRKLDKWLQPGGHADGDADVADVALREAAEESGLTDLAIVETHPRVLDLDIHVIPERRDRNGEIIDDAHEHHDVRFLIRATCSETLHQNDESNDLRWCTADEVRGLTRETSVIRLLEKAAQQTAGSA